MLTEAVRRRPHSVILLDEVEKAHPDVFKVLLQLLDDGRLTDGEGRTVEFTQTLVLMTSNLRHEDQVAPFFRPEFINRLDDILSLHELRRDQIRHIVDVQVARIAIHSADADALHALVTQHPDLVDADVSWETAARTRSRRGTPGRRARTGGVTAFRSSRARAFQPARSPRGAPRPTPPCAPR